MVIDASLWVSRTLPQDADHAVSRKWLSANVGPSTPLELPALALAEVSGALARRTGDAEAGRGAVRQLLRLPTLRVVSIDTALGQAAAELATRLRLRGADAVYVAVARAYGVPLVTLDEEVATRARDTVAIVRP